MDEIFLDIVNYASAGEHTKFGRLRNSSEYIEGRLTRRSIKVLLSSLQHAADRVFKKYCKDVIKQQANVSSLLAYKKFQHVISFYKEELRLLEETLNDYETYLAEGNFINAFVLGKERDY